MKITNILARLKYDQERFYLFVEAKYDGIYYNNTIVIKYDSDKIKLHFEAWYSADRIKLFSKIVSQNSNKIIEIITSVTQAREILNDNTWKTLTGKN